MRADELFRRHHLRVFHYFRRWTGDTGAAEDLTQEVFVRVLKGLRSYRAEGREEAWIFTIARNVMRNHRRQRAVAPRHDDLPSDEPSRPGDPLNGLALDHALARLGELDRDVFLLRELGGLSHGEIASVCDLSNDAVRSRIYRARESLRSALSGRSGARVPRFTKESRP